MRHELVQRDSELGAIERLLRAARRGSGGALLVEGPPGMGKSSLLEAAVSRARALGFEARVARADDLEGRLPFAVAHQLFAATLRRLPDTDPQDLLSAATPRHEAVLGLYELAVRLAERRPLAVIIDDAHHSDEPSLDWLRFMLPRLPSLPIALILTVLRPGGEGMAMNLLDESGVETLVLPSLGDTAAGVLLRAELGVATDHAFARACRTATAGNPRLLSELARGVAAERLAPTRENAAAAAELSSPQLNRWVAGRLRRLSPAQRALTEALAVLGPEATLLDAGAVAGLDPAAAAGAADRLRQAGLLATEDKLCFAQPIDARAVLAGLPAGERSARHLFAAGVLERHGATPDRIAAQLFESEPGGLVWVSRQLRAAAEGAAGRGDPALAVRLLRRALAEAVPGERGSVLHELGVAECRLPDASAVGHLREAHARATTTGDRAAVALALSRTLVAGGQVTECIDVLDAAALEQSEGDLRLHLEAELCAVSRFHPPRARGIAARLGELAATGLLDPQGRRAMLACLAAETALTGGSVAEAAVLAERALAGGRLVRESSCESPVLHLACLTLTWCDRPRTALVHLDDALRDARERGSVVGLELASACRAHAHLRAGDVQAAETDARAVLDAAPAGGPLAAPLATSALLLSLLEQERHAEAEVALGPPPDAVSPALGASVALLYARGRLRFESGDAPAAREDLEGVGALLEECGVSSTALIAWRSAAALANAALGEHDRASELAGEELALARRSGAPRAIAVALQTCARVTGSDGSIAKLAEAAALLEESEARLDHAHCLFELGAAMRRARRRRDARDPLHRSLELARSLGASALERRARDELAIAGARPRRDAYSGRDALTPAEERVAELAAGGMGNREIAAALVLSTKTVETHLGHVYAKLGIASRRDLACALAPPAKDQGSSLMRT